jgi:copper(I)-binding protein
VSMTKSRSRASALIAAVISALALVGCAPTATDAHSITPTFSEGWIKAAPAAAAGNHTGTGVFGVIDNPGSMDVQLVKAVNNTEGLSNAPLEVHEVAMNSAGQMVMQEVKGGINIPAKGSTTLKPGGLHIMYWDLERPLPAGTKVSLTLEFSNGIKVPVTVVAREIANAQEKYDPSASATPMPSIMDHGH